MTASGTLTPLIVTGLAVVAIGALALAGWVHPAAPEPAMMSYLPQITLPAVLMAAAGDGINPCAFTVLLLLVTAVIATLNEGGGTVGKVRARLLSRGGLFIAAVFLTYLAVGVGAMGTPGLFTRRHWPARIAALLSHLVLQPGRGVGYGYLVLFNAVFMLPLLGVLMAATARPSLRKRAEWNRMHGERVHLVLGGGVVLGGLAILATV